MGSISKYPVYLLLIGILLFPVLPLLADDDRNVADIRIELPKTKADVYHLLRMISDKTGYLFIYDSKVVDSDKKVKIDKGEYSLQQAVRKIVRNDNVKLRIVGNHILLYFDENSTIVANQLTEGTDKNTQAGSVTFGGTLLDRMNSDPIPYATISINNSSIGTIANKDGEFRLVVPDSLQKGKVRFSSVGYSSSEMEVSLVAGQKATFMLEPLAIPLQEVVVRKVDPVKEIEQMLEKRVENYSNRPAYLTTFYREGVDSRKNKELTEAVFKVYKTDFSTSPENDQVKLFKMRKVFKKEEADTINFKMKSGVNAILVLDLIKELPDFLAYGENFHYFFAHTDISVIDNRRVNVISFSQKEHVEGPYYKGELYIDAENHALVRAEFEINRQYIKSATEMMIAKKDRKIDVTLDKASYIVSYKPVDGVYYVNHIRGELRFKFKKKKLFSTPFYITSWFEMVTCEIDTNNVKRFPRSDRLPTQNIFSETKFDYDMRFWGRFNTIMPEEKLKELIADYFSNIN